MAKKKAAIRKAAPKKAAENPIEAAMVAAIKKCHADGITDPKEVGEAMKKAREKLRSA